MTTDVLVTGGAGFIGSHLVDALLDRGDGVRVLDDLSTGRLEHLGNLRNRQGLRFVKGRAEDPAALEQVMPGASLVVHAAADPEIRTAPNDPVRHVRAHVEPTLQVLETMRRHDVPRIAFTSTSTVYGEAIALPTPETYSPMEPISLYGAGKLAAESLIASYCHTYGLTGLAYRFANVVGPRATHGIVVDFVAKLRRDPKRLEVLGDGTQEKSYVHTQDCVAAMLHLLDRQQRRPFDAYNLGSDDTINVLEIAQIVKRAAGCPDARVETTGGVQGGRGWPGDVKRMHLSVDRLRSTGFNPRFTSRQAVEATAAWVVEHAR